MKSLTALWSVIVVMGVAPSAWADCEMRPTTAKEAAYFKQTSAALQGAMPAAPAAWTQAVREESIDEFVCGHEGDFGVRVRATYTYHIPKEESDRKYAEFRMVDKEVEKLRELPPDVEKEYQGWLDKMSVANRASNKAYKDGDKKLADRLSDEAEGYSQKARAIKDQYRASIQPKIDRLEAKKKTIHYGDQVVNVSVIANEHDDTWADPERASELTLGKMPKGNTTGLKVQVIRVIVEGNMPERDVILKAIERDKLARLAQ